MGRIVSVLGGCLVAVAVLAVYDLVVSTGFAGRRFAALTRRRDGAVRSPLAWLLVGAVRLYRVGWSGRIAGVCRFEPSCSSYALEALRSFGGVRGGGLAAYRLGRCQPLATGGFDPVPTRHHHGRASQTADAVYPADPLNSADQTADAERRLGTRA